MNPALECLRRTTPDLELKYPSDAEAHFKEIHTALAPFMKDWHEGLMCYAGYCGPWIENDWISHFNETWTAAGPDAKLSTVFGPYLPIFYAWSDMLRKNGGTNGGVWTVLQEVLRKDVAYITVSQASSGLLESEENTDLKQYPNLMVLNGGGYGHVPVPLLLKQREEIEVPMSARKHWMSFMGATNWDSNGPGGLRTKMIDAITPHADETHKVEFGQGSNWPDVIAHSQFSLCPRGFGRTSFRLTETVQMGRIPIYVYSDVAWVPYADMFEQFGYMSQVGKVADLAKKLKTEISKHQIRDMEKVLEEIAPTHFTMPGVMNQISGFMTSQKSDLRCQVLPPTVRGA